MYGDIKKFKILFLLKINNLIILNSTLQRWVFSIFCWKFDTMLEMVNIIIYLALNNLLKGSYVQIV